MYSGRKRSFESWLILVCFLTCSVALALSNLYYWKNVFTYPYEFDRVWDQGQMFLFVHLFFVWYVMSRSGKLLEYETGHLLPADMLNAFVVIPFGNLFLRFRTLITGFRSIGKNRKDKPFPWLSIIAVILSLCILGAAVSLLMDADEAFSRLFQDIYARLDFDVDGYVMMRLIFSIPAGRGCGASSEDASGTRRKSWRKDGTEYMLFWTA